MPGGLEDCGQSPVMALETDPEAYFLSSPPYPLPPRLSSPHRLGNAKPTCLPGHRSRREHVGCRGKHMGEAESPFPCPEDGGSGTHLWGSL